MAGLIEGQGVKVAYRSRAELGSGFTDWVRGRLSAEPWIADEGATDCGLRQGFGEAGLRMRGMAFDDHTTIVWDEDEVREITAGPADPKVITEGLEAEPLVITRSSQVIVRQRPDWPKRLQRFDYFREGALVASRYTCPQGDEGGPDA